MSKEKHRPESASPKKAAIAAIDFGTTCTGYAYNLRKDHGNRLNDINIDQAWIGTAQLGLQAPTTVLMTPDKDFDSFGFEAENKYKRLSIKNEHRSWYYFQYFKMKLHHEPDISRDTMLEDAYGKKMKAITVFTEAIKYVKDHLLEKLKGALMEDINLHDIQWVITVPAIWRNSAKQFMRESASKAGIPNEHLLLALEPESAAIFCKELALTRSEGVEGVFLKAFDPGEKYIVLDLGGGTVDTTAHEVLTDGTLKELLAATGGPWGGQLINQAFEEFIEKLVTPGVLRKFRQKWMSNWIELQKDFEKKKRAFSPATPEVDLNFPVELENIFKEETKRNLNDRVLKEYNPNVELVQHSMLLKADTMKSFFDTATNAIIEHIHSLLRVKSLTDVSSILLVGGFSESPIVSTAVRKSFRKLRVIAPGTAGSAIIQGAVMFGCDQSVIASRISPYTYGVHTRKTFQDSIHPPGRKKMYKEKAYVDNAFDKLIEKSENVYVGGKSKERNYIISNNKNPDVFWKVYQSDDKNPTFCDDTGCKYIGKLKITIPEQIKNETIRLRVSMACKGTELEAMATSNINDCKCVAKFDFLEKEHLLGSDLEDTVITVTE